MALSRFAAAAAAFTMLIAGAEAQEPEPYSLDGETIRFLIPNGAGGMADTQVRLLAPFLGKHLPGDPTFVVQNLEGAGGEVMLQYLSELDPSDLVIFTTQSGMPFRARAGLLDTELFDPRSVNWVGSFRGATLYCLVRTDSGIESLDDLREQTVLFGATTAAGNDYAVYTLLNEQLGLMIEPVVGYGSGGTIALAVERGEVQGICNNYANFTQFLAPMVEAGDARILFYMGPDRRDDIDAPYLYDLSMGDEARSFIQAAVAAISFAGPYAMRADADPQFVAAVRDAFAGALTDAEFIATAEALGVDLLYLDDAAIAAAVDALYATPDDVIDRIGDLFFGD